MKHAYIAIIIIALVFSVVTLVARKTTIVPINAPQDTDQQLAESARISFTGFAASQGITDLSIAPNQTVSGQTTITGMAQGYMFEGSFPVQIITPTQQVVWSGFASAKGEWMTSDPVKFTFSVDMSTLPTGQLSIILKQDDPSGGESGKPVQQLEIPIVNQ